MSQNPKYTGVSAKAFEENSRKRDINSILELIKYANNIIYTRGSNYTIEEARAIYKAGEAVKAINRSYTAEDRAILNAAREIEWKLEEPQYRARFLGEEVRNSNEGRRNNNNPNNQQKKSARNHTTRRTTQRNTSKSKVGNGLNLPKLSPRAKSLIRRFCKSPAAYFFTALTITGVAGSIINDIKENDINSEKEISSSTMDILIPSETSYAGEVVVPYLDELGAKDDDVKYILDFINYPNPDLNPLMSEWISSDSIGGFIFECGAGSHDYPYAVRNFQDEELESRMSQVLSPEKLSGNMGDLESLENIIQQIIDTPKNGETKPYGFYFYSTANTYAEADIEAEYIANFYEILQKHMQEQNPNYSIYDNTFPIAIDIEENGEEKFGETPEEISKLRDQRTDAMIHLVDKLVEKGVTTEEKGVTIYMDINRVAEQSYVNHDRLIESIQEKGVRVANWGTRALDETFGSDKIYKSTNELIYDTMNDINNLNWMKNEFIGKSNTIEHTEYLNLCQIHLDQEIRGPIGLDQKVDVNITTSNNIQWMLSEEERAIETPFLTQIQMIEDRKAQDADNRQIEPDEKPIEGLANITKIEMDDGDR